jgi:hypothetical protein
VAESPTKRCAHVIIDKAGQLPPRGPVTNNEESSSVRHHWHVVKVLGGLTIRRSWHGPASARRPSHLAQRNLNGVTPPASRASNAGRRRAALP